MTISAGASAPATPASTAQSPPPVLGSSRGRFTSAAIVALLAVHAVFAWLVKPGGIDTGQDDVMYLLLGRSLRAFGYNDLFLVGEPLHNMYPPAYPAFLAIVGGVFGESVMLAQVAGIAMMVAALGIFTFIVRRIWGDALAVLTLSVLSVNPHLVRSAGRIATDAPYMLLSFAAIGLIAFAPPRPRNLVLIGALSILAALTRSVGVTLVGAVGLYWFLQRRYAATVAFGLTSAVTVGGWLLVTVLAPEQYVGRSYVADALYGNVPGEPQDSPPFLEVILGRVVVNTREYLRVFVPNRIGFPELEGAAFVMWAIAVVVTVALAMGTVALWRRWRVAALYLMAYAALMAVWPWALGRYLNVVIPLLTLSFLLGASVVGSHLGRSGRRGVLVLAALPLLLLGTARSVRRVEEASPCRWGANIPGPGCHEGRTEAFYRSMDAIARLPDDAVIIARRTEPIYWFTGKKTIAFGRTAAAGLEGFPDLLRENPNTYVHLGAFERTEYGNLLPLLEATCSQLVVVASIEPLNYVFRLAAPGEAVDGEACAATARYREGARPSDREDR